MKTAIIHDWLVNYAGSERCVESFTNIYPDADVFTLVDFLDNEQRDIILKGKKARTSFIQQLPFARTKHRYYLPFFSKAIEQFDLSDYELILSSSHAVAKGVLSSPGQLHICYCHSPMRYAWDNYHTYIKEAGLEKGIRGYVLKNVLHRLRIWDVTSANRVDHFIANSNYIARKIRKIYRRDADVIHPPVDTDRFECYSQKENFFITASRMVPYKKIDLIVRAFGELPDKKLLVIGSGPEFSKIKSLASPNIEFLGYQPFDSLKSYLQRAKAFVFAAEEDFGIVVLEAMACGTPVIALNKGGTAETVIQGRTGILFNTQSVDSIVASVKDFEKSEAAFDPAELRKYAEQFSRNIFEEKIASYVKNKCDHFFNRTVL